MPYLAESMLGPDFLLLYFTLLLATVSGVLKEESA